MKSKTIAALSLALVSCMLGGCANRTEQATVTVADSGGASAQNFTLAVGSSETVSSSQAVSISVPKNGSSLISSKTPVSVIIPTPDHSEYSSDTPEPSFSENISSSDLSTAKTEQPFVPVIPDEPIGTNSYKTLNYSEVRGVWISYMELAELSSGSESEFRDSLGDVYDNCVSLGINTVFVHVRSHGDAYYNSAYFPRTKYIGGSYDPLPVMIDEAHKRGLSFQAWINPMRGCSISDLSRENGYPMYGWAGGETRLVELDDHYYLNPAYDEVIDLISKGAEEIIANYDVDGLHIDDYFYPTTEEWFDSAAFAESSFGSLSDFRFANCDKLVSSLYSAVKRANNNAMFGVSPQGNYENNYAYMYADVEKWCGESGYLDYIMPQIYFGFKNAVQPFSDVVKQWDNIAAMGKVPLIVGLSPSKIGTEDAWGGQDGEYEWINDKDILKRQYIESTEAVSYGGICLYSYNSLFNSESDKKAQVDMEVAAFKAAMN